MGCLNFWGRSVGLFWCSVNIQAWVGFPQNCANIKMHMYNVVELLAVVRHVCILIAYVLHAKSAGVTL
jgi:hypothetical protein